MRRADRARSAGLKAVVIVGDVGSSTDTYKNDMDAAVAALQNHGVEVRKFYYGDSSFTWADVVQAAQGAQFILYMGHGVYGWGGDLDVGGFYLGPGQFVSPTQVKNDLTGVLADWSTIIFSHACFTAGSAGNDPVSPPLPQSEAERRVRTYATPFVDVGMNAYFANNYYGSAARTVNLLFSQYTMGDTFKGGTGYQPSNLHTLSYPKSGYDLWLDGTPGHWSLAFVGPPGAVFSGQTAPPQLGNLPSTLTFVYSIPDQRLNPPQYEFTPANIGNGDPLTWTVDVGGAWLSASPITATTPASFGVAPTSFVTDTVSTLTGTITVTVQDPPGTTGSPYTMTAYLQVNASSLYDTYLPAMAADHAP